MSYVRSGHCRSALQCGPRQQRQTSRNTVAVHAAEVYGPKRPEPDISHDDLGPYAMSEDGKPMWLKDLERDAEHDPDVARLLEKTGGAPDAVRDQMASYCDGREGLAVPKLGSQEAVRIVFRDYDPGAAYFWLEMYTRPTAREYELIEQTISSWFLVGKLGGYNSMNLQVHNMSGEDLSHLVYKQKRDDEFLTSFYHDLSELERKEQWIRFRADLGTGDELGLDVLINTLRGFSREYVGIKQLCIGGQNEDWPIPEAFTPSVSMSPMQMNGREDDEAEEEEDAEWDEEDFDKLEAALEEMKRSDPERYRKLQEVNEEMTGAELDEEEEGHVMGVERLGSEDLGNRDLGQFDFFKR